VATCGGWSLTFLYGVSDLQGPSSPSRLLPSKMGQMHCPKISVTNYRPTQRTIPDEQNVSIKVLQLVGSGKKKQVLT